MRLVVLGARVLSELPAVDEVIIGNLPVERAQKLA
jgi:hypothetical protein